MKQLCPDEVEKKKALSGPARRRFVVLDSGAADGVTNMAVDAALLDHARATGESTLRVYAWSVPTLSFGRHERARGRFDAGRLERERIGVVRRPTGGRALLHHHEVTYSVTAPVLGTSLAESYRAINALLIEALSLLGVSAEEAEPRGAPLRPQGAPCFAEPNRGELVADIPTDSAEVSKGTLVSGKGKLVGSAQWRDGDALLQHGSILLENDQGLIDTLLSEPIAMEAEEHLPPGRVATLNGILNRRVTYGEVRDTLHAALGNHAAHEDVTSPSVAESDSGILATVEAHRVRFADPAWTWRR